MKKKAMVKEMELFAPTDFGEISSKGDVAEREVEVASLRANDIATLFVRLSQSKFRSSFYLNQKDKAIIAEKGLPTISSPSMPRVVAAVAAWRSGIISRREEHSRQMNRHTWWKC